jgi:hypothetical protein
MPGTARKHEIVRAAGDGDYVSEVAQAIERLADAGDSIAAALCYEAATRYIGTAGEQRQIAATMFHTAKRKFGGVKYDGERIEAMDVRTLDALWQKLISGRMKR